MRVSERWLPVVGYEGVYEVSDLGRVRGLGHTVTRTNRKPFTVRARVKTARLRPDGRLSVTLCRGRASRPFLVHRLVAFAFLGSPNADEQVNHVDGNPANNELANLEWATPKENMNHSLETGLSKNFGDNHQNSKLKASDVPTIQGMASSGVKQRVIAKRFGVNQSQISRILSGEGWRRACL